MAMSTEKINKLWLLESGNEKKHLVIRAKIASVLKELISTV